MRTRSPCMVSVFLSLHVEQLSLGSRDPGNSMSSPRPRHYKYHRGAFPILIPSLPCNLCTTSLTMHSAHGKEVEDAAASAAASSTSAPGRSSGRRQGEFFELVAHDNADRNLAEGERCTHLPIVCEDCLRGATGGQPILEYAVLTTLTSLLLRGALPPPHGRGSRVERRYFRDGG